MRLAPRRRQPHLPLTFAKLLTAIIAHCAMTKRAANPVLKLRCLHIFLRQGMSTGVALTILSLTEVMIYRHSLVEYKAFALPPTLFFCRIFQVLKDSTIKLIDLCYPMLGNQR